MAVMMATRCCKNFPDRSDAVVGMRHDRRLGRRIVGVVLGLVALASPADAPAAARASSVLAPRMINSETYAETFTTIADFNDGTYLQVQLAVTHIGSGDGKGLCRLLWVSPSGEVHTDKAEVGRDGWHASSGKGSNETRPGTQTSSEGALSPQRSSHASAQAPGGVGLKVGPCRMQYTGSATHIDVQLHDTAVLLSVDGPLVRRTPPGHPVHVDGSDAVYESHILNPRGRAHATLVRGQSQPLELTGGAYADHSRGTALPIDLGRGWIRFRALRGKCQGLLLVRFPPADAKSTAPDGYRLAPGSTKFEPLKNLVVGLPQVADRKKSAVPRIEGHSGSWTFAIDASRALYRHAPLDELGFVGRVLGKWVGDSVTTTYRAVINDNSACSPMSGILEVTHVRR